METSEYYKIIRNSVQLAEVTLVSMNCFRNFKDSEEVEGDEPKSHHVQLAFKRKVNLLSTKHAEIFLLTKVGVDEGPFEFEIEYRGICFLTNEISETAFEQYVYDQVVPLLMPYVRECIASTMARMDLPIFTIPTIDILDTLEVNLNPEDIQE
ncbi:MAG: protein-export chaperone SecB [Paenisporosarcina sp.]